MRLVVLKFDRFKYFSPEQPLNKYDISVTFEVSKNDKSIDINLEQYTNAPSIVWSEEVFIFPKDIFSKSKQNLNILYIEVILEASNLDKSTSIKFFNSLNKFSNVFNWELNIRII